MRPLAIVVALSVASLAFGAARPCALLLADACVSRADALADRGDVLGSTEWLARAERILETQ